MARRTHRRPWPFTRGTDNRLAVDVESIDRGRIADAERDPDCAKRLMAALSDALASGAELSDPMRSWLTERLARIGAGEDGNQALGVRRRQGDRSLSLTEVRRRLQLIALFAAVNDFSPSEAAAQLALHFGHDESTWRRLLSEYPDHWTDAKLVAQWMCKRQQGLLPNDRP